MSFQSLSGPGCSAPTGKKIWVTLEKEREGEENGQRWSEPVRQLMFCMLHNMTHLVTSQVFSKITKIIETLGERLCMCVCEIVGEGARPRLTMNTIPSQQGVPCRFRVGRGW